MNDKDVKRPYLERNHEAKGPHVPKGLMGLIILLMGLMGCSGEEAAELVQPETGTAIAFLVVGVLHFLFILLVFFKRHSWIEKPLVRFFANLFLNN